MTTTHTPGPWHVEGNTVVSTAAIRVAVIDTPRIHAAVTDEDSEANGRLIAAAPDLLAALEAIVDDARALPVPMGPDIANPFPPTYGTLIDAAIVAINQAKGA